MSTIPAGPHVSPEIGQEVPELRLHERPARVDVDPTVTGTTPAPNP